jgi:hypothetical protein
MMRYRVHYAVYYVNNAYYPNKTLTVTALSPEEAKEQVKEFELARADGVPIRTFSFDRITELVPANRSRARKAGG